MSGIVGIYHPSGRPVDRRDLVRMVECLAHRGPDGAMLWHEGAVGLGHRMLHTTPESLHETLPLVHPAGHRVLTADARIDNREELINLLTPHTPRITDSELILAAYDKWGQACPEKLLGDFAFVIWDGAEQHLFCARDHLGLKPFYYHHTPGQLFAFGSEIKAIVQLAEVPRRPNEVKIADYLANIFLDNTDTFYEGIFRLPPGHTLLVNRAGIRARAYWSLDPSHTLRLGSDEAYAEAFRERFMEAVACRLRSASPVGTLLSGGLDSSSVTCAIRTLNGSRAPRLQTFSAIFDTVQQCDERSFIHAVLEQGGVEPHFIQGDAIDPLNDVKRFLPYLDQPIPGNTLSIHWSLYDAAARQGLRVMLEGFGGDETVSHGGEYIHQLALQGRWITLFAELRKSARNGEITPARSLKYFKGHLFKYGPWPLKAARKALRKSWAAARRLAVRQNGVPDSPPPWGKMLDATFAQRMHIPERLQGYRKTLATSATTHNAQEHHYKILTGTLQPWSRELLDITGAAHSLEIRAPLEDKRLVEFCLSLPPEQKRNGGWGRLVLRRAMEGLIPKDVQWRPDKINFIPVLPHAIASHDQGILDDVLAEAARFEPYVDIDAYRSLCQRLTTNPSVVHEAELSDLLRVTELALWLQSIQTTPRVQAAPSTTTRAIEEVSR